MKPWIHFSQNQRGRDLFVGDIHGCLDLFNRLLETASFNPETDRVFSVGDLVDRGKSSADVVRLLKEPWFFAVKGNHEDMTAAGMNWGSSVSIHIANGGGWFYEIEFESERLEIYDLVNDLPIAIEVDTSFGKIGVVHAECPYEDWEDFKRVLEKESAERDHAVNMALWARRKASGKDARLTKNISRVVCGHTILRDWSLVGNHMFIDTGAFHFGMLTAWCPQEDHVYQVRRD